MTLQGDAADTKPDVLVVATRTPEVLAALQTHTRQEQLLLDVAALPDRAAHHAHYRGVCW
jgi:hypothetical protein